MNNIAYLLLGGNMGDRAAFMKEALEEIKLQAGTIISQSALYNSAAWPADSKQNDHLNQAVCINTPLSAQKLLDILHIIEAKLGRARKQKWEARVIDIDILFFNSDIIHTPTLTIPHPRLQERRFTLIPLVEITGDFIHPLLNKSIRELLYICRDTLPVIPA